MPHNPTVREIAIGVLGAFSGFATPGASTFDPAQLEKLYREALIFVAKHGELRDIELVNNAYKRLTE